MNHHGAKSPGSRRNARAERSGVMRRHLARIASQSESSRVIYIWPEEEVYIPGGMSSSSMEGGSHLNPGGPLTSLLTAGPVRQAVLNAG